MPKAPFGFDTPEQSPGFLLWQTSITWQRQIKKSLEPYGITHPQFVIMALTLWHMKNNEAPIQNRIVELSKLDKMTVSQALKKLVANKLMKRIECKTDTRSKTITLTKKGENLIHKLIPLIEQIDKDYLTGLNNNEIELLKELLKKCNSKAGQVYS